MTSHGKLRGDFVMKLSVIVITVAVMSAWIGVSEAQQAGTV